MTGRGEMMSRHVLRSRHRFQQGKEKQGHNLNPMSRQDNEKINNFKSQHEKGSCD